MLKIATELQRLKLQMIEMNPFWLQSSTVAQKLNPVGQKKGLWVAESLSRI